jgi:hypothetical protein
MSASQDQAIAMFVMAYELRMAQLPIPSLNR